MAGNQEPKIVPELGVRDFQTSLNFYTAVLGFSVDYQRYEEGFAYLDFEGVKLMIDAINIGRTWLKAEIEYPLGRGMNLQIRTSDVDALYQKARQSGAEIFLEMEEKWYDKDDHQVGNKQFIVCDPDGYLLRFYEDLGQRTY